MVKSCCAVGCKNEFVKGGKRSFYKFPSEKALRNKWIAAVKRNNRSPSEYDRICSDHFVSGRKSKNPLAPNYVPGLFKHIESPVKRRLERDMERFQRRQAMMKKRRIQATAASIAVLHDGTGNETNRADVHQQENNQVELPHADNQEELPNTEGLNEALKH